MLNIECVDFIYTKYSNYECFWGIHMYYFYGIILDTIFLEELTLTIDREETFKKMRLLNLWIKLDNGQKKMKVS